jgi:hypothetical protein
MKFTYQISSWGTTIVQLVKQLQAFLWEPKLHHTVKRSPSVNLILKLLNQLYNFFRMYINVILTFTISSPKFSILFRALRLKLCTYFSSALGDVSQPHLTLLRVITIIYPILKKMELSLSAPLRVFPRPSLTSSLLGANISNTLNLYSSLTVSNKLTQPYKTTGNTTVMYIWVFRYEKGVSGRWHCSTDCNCLSQIYDRCHVFENYICWLL